LSLSGCGVINGVVNGVVDVVDDIVVTGGYVTGGIVDDDIVVTGWFVIGGIVDDDDTLFPHLTIPDGKEFVFIFGGFVTGSVD
jgi:hypothetical protein